MSAIIYFFLLLKVSYERFLYNSVIAFYGTDVLSPKNIQIAQGNQRETNPCEFLSLNISYKFSRFIFSLPSGTSLSETTNKPFARGNLPLS